MAQYWNYELKLRCWNTSGHFKLSNIFVSEILSSVTSRFDFSNAQCSHSYSAVNISSPSIVALDDSGQLLCAKSNSWPILAWNHPTLYPLELPLALSGQMSSCFIYVMALLHPTVWHSLQAMVWVSPLFPLQLSARSDFSFLSLCFPFNLILKATVVTS